MMPKTASAAEPAGTEPRKVLVIDPSGEARDFLRYCVARVWSKLIITPYDFALGRPGANFDWSRFDLIILEQQLNVPGEEGLEWLREIRRNERAPPVIMLVGAPTDELRREAKRAGAGAFLGKDEITSNAFVRCVRRVLSGAPSTGDTALLPMPSRALKADSPVPPVVAAPQVAAPPPAMTARRPEGGAPAAKSEVHPEVPGYRIQKLIARGNMASVYLARGDGDSQLIALKLLRLEGHTDPNSLKRFMQEYQVIARLEHKHIVRIFERGFGSDFAFIAMEYCQAGDLKARIRNGVSAAQALSYLRQIMLALGAAHAIGIVHRDLKPANVLLRDVHSLVITDFGIAKDIESDARLTAAKSILGSLYYVSPETIRHDQPDHRSDLYSAGVLLYQMLTSTLPFSASTVSAMLEAHLRAPIPRLPHEFALLQPLVDGLLAKNSEDRFQSAEDVIAGIDWIADSLKSGGSGSAAASGAR
ncbi:MAG: protein kinase [Steroidobacteraceae bacterium]